MLTNVPASPVSSPARFLPSAPRLRTPSEDRQGAGAAETCLGGLCPLPASRLDFLPRTLCLPFPSPGLTCRSKLSSLPLCAVFQEGEWGEEAAVQLQPRGGRGQTTLSPHSDLSSSRQETEDASQEQCIVCSCMVRIPLYIVPSKNHPSSRQSSSRLPSPPLSSCLCFPTFCLPCKVTREATSVRPPKPGIHSQLAAVSLHLLPRLLLLPQTFLTITVSSAFQHSSE